MMTITLMPQQRKRSWLSCNKSTTLITMANNDEFNFENDDSTSVNSSVACKSSQSSTTSSLLNGKGRTKSQRRKMRLSQQRQEEEKIVRFSLSPGRDSLDSALSSKGKRRRKKTTSSARSTQASSQSSLESSASLRGSASRSSRSFPSQSSRQSPQRQLSSQESSRSFRSSQDSQDSRVSNNSSSSCSQQEPFDTSPIENVNIRGAGTDVLAVQDAGSYRMLFDDASYLCSTIIVGGKKSALDAACDLALLLSNAKTRAILLSIKEGGAALAAILEIFSAVSEPYPVKLEGILRVEQDDGDYDTYCGAMLLSPDGRMIAPKNDITKPKTKTARKRAMENQQNGIAVKNSPPSNPLLHEALAAVLYFISWDCTVSQPHSSSATALKARLIRSAILQHPTALKCTCNLALQDPIVESILSDALKGNDTGSVKIGHVLSSSLTRNARNEDDASRTSSIDTRDSMPATDLTLEGRKKRRKKRRIQIVGQQKKPPQQQQLESIDEDQEFAFSDSPIKPQPAVQVQMSFTSDDDLSFNSSQRRRGGDDNASVSTAASEQVAEKLTQIRAAMDPLETNGNDNDVNAKQAQHTCGRVDDHGPGQSRAATNLFARGDLVLKSISRIIDGKEGDEVSCIENEADDDNGNAKRSSQDNEQEEDDEEEQLKKNPLLVTNTLLREGGTLPALARAMAETLSAVIAIISSDTADICIECLSHLKQRVAILAPLIDGACCLTTENRMELCGDGSQLLSSILLFLKTFSDMDSNDFSLATSLLDEIALSSLRTLTSLTHDNSVARSLMLMSYKVNTGASSVPLPGVLILANLIWKTVTNSKQSQLHSAYDMVIFCLNTLSNVVEAKNLRRLLSEYKVPVVTPDGASASLREELFLTWLARWLFLETTSFRNAVMLGTFGEKALRDTASHDEMRHLEKDDEEHLITAGNGFIFLACLMISKSDHAPEHGADESLFRTIREVILEEIQVGGGGLLLIKNTLKAFCNFYHYSLGDLSVAIVAPVGQIIVELERMQGRGKTEQL